MKKLIMLLFCIAAGLSAEESTNDVFKGRAPKQFFSFNFDRPNWKGAYYDHSGETIVIEWTNNEPVTNWSELVTGNIYFIDTDKINAQQYANYFVDQIKPGSIDFMIKAIIDTPDDVVFEWAHKGSGIWPAQREIVHFIRGKDAIYRLAYTVKEAAFDKEKYDVMLTNIKEAKLVDQ
jgi:hypothetical protein